MEKTALILIAFLGMALLFGCAQQQQSNGTGKYDEASSPYVSKIEPPKIRLDGFEFEFTSVGKASTLTLLFQKDNLTKITKMPDNVQELDSQPISQQQLADLAQTVSDNKFFTLPQDEYGEFDSTDGPALVLLGKMNGQKKLVSCQKDCPPEVDNITQKVQQFIEPQ
ncbi:MAG: hypothetical protein AABW85_05590 [archaeon]